MPHEMETLELLLTETGLSKQDAEDVILRRKRILGPLYLAIAKWKELSRIENWTGKAPPTTSYRASFQEPVPISHDQSEFAPSLSDLQELFFAIGGGEIGYRSEEGGFFQHVTPRRANRAERVAEEVARDLGWISHPLHEQTSREFLKAQFTLQELFPANIGAVPFEHLKGKDDKYGILRGIPVYADLYRLYAEVKKGEPSDGEVENLKFFYWHTYFIDQENVDKGQDIGITDLREHMAGMLRSARTDQWFWDTVEAVIEMPDIYETQEQKAGALNQYIVNEGRGENPYGPTPQQAGVAQSREEKRKSKELRRAILYLNLHGTSITPEQQRALTNLDEKINKGDVIQRGSVPPELYSILVHEGMKAQLWTEKRINQEFQASVMREIDAGRISGRGIASMTKGGTLTKMYEMMTVHAAAEPRLLGLTPRQLMEFFVPKVTAMMRQVINSDMKPTIEKMFDDRIAELEAADPYGEDKKAITALKQQKPYAVNATLITRDDHERGQDDLQSAAEAERDAEFANMEAEEPGERRILPPLKFERTPFTDENIISSLHGSMDFLIAPHLAHYAAITAAETAADDLEAAKVLAKTRDDATSAINKLGGNVAARNLVELVEANVEAGGGDMLDVHTYASDLIKLYGDSPEAALSAFTSSFTEETAGYETLTEIVSTQQMKAETPMLAALTESAKGVINKAQSEIDELEATKRGLLEAGTPPDDPAVTGIDDRTLELRTEIANAGAGISDIPMRPGYDIGGVGRLFDKEGRDVTYDFIFRAEAAREARRGQFTQEDYNELIGMVPAEDRGLAQEFLMTELEGLRQQYETGVLAGGDIWYEREMQAIAKSLAVYDPEAGLTEAESVMTPEGELTQQSQEDWRARQVARIDPKDGAPTELPPPMHPEFGEEAGTYQVDERTTFTIPEGGRRPVSVPVEEAPGEYSRRILGAQAMAGARSNLEARKRAQAGTAGDTFMKFARSKFPSALEEFRRTRGAEAVAFTGSRARRGRMTGGRRVRF